MSLLGDVVPTPAGVGGHFEALSAPAANGPKRDLKKMALIVGLSVLAWVSTYTGMLELIQANLGEVGIVEKVATGLAVAMLQIMIVWLLDQLFSPIHASIKAFYIVGYLFLTLISVGFAFGFYWKVLESRSATTSSAESSIGTVQSALRGAETRLDQLVSTLEALTAISTQKADQEAANGNSCPGSKPGAGPRMAMRKGDAEKFSFGSNFVKGRSEQVKGDIKALDVDLQRILKDDKGIIDAKSGTRNEFLKGMGRKLEETTTRYNALRTDAQLRQIRQDAAERAEKTTFPDSKGGTYACPDGQLQSALRGVVGAIDQLPTLEKPKIAATEGSEAVIEAFRRLTMTLFGAMTFKLPPTPEELREKQTKAVQSMENPAAALAAQKSVNLEAAGLGKRDYIPLGIAIFVDFCLLMVSFGRPANRFAKTAMELQAAELGPQSAIVGINREVHEDRIVRRNFELFQHVVIHFGNHYLAAVPLAAPRLTPDGKELTPAERDRLQIEAQTLVTLFSGLELNNSIVDRGLPPFLLLLGGARLVRRRLLKQESKFARAGAFRFYRFRNRAWPEMILGTVMGTAKKYKSELAANRAEEAEHEKEQRRLDIEERKAATAQRSAVNMQRLAEAKLRTIEAESRQRAIEDQLSQADQMRNQSLPLSSGLRPHAAVPPTHRPDMGQRNPMRPSGPMPQATYAQGPSPGFIPAGSGHPQPHAGLHPQTMRPASMTPPANGSHPLVEPANHNTAPAERARPVPVPSLGVHDARALPDNVVPMPDRFERALGVDVPAGPAHVPVNGYAQPVAAPGVGTSLQAPTAPRETQALVPATHGGPVARAGDQLETASDLGKLLRTVAVTQMRVAHEVAAAVHRIENGQAEEAGTMLAEGNARGSQAPSRQSGGMQGNVVDVAPAVVAVVGVSHQAALPTAQSTASGSSEEAAPAREQQAWRDANPAVHDDIRRAFAGRGLAHDPGLDDAGTIAARYAPVTQHPR